MKKLFLIGDSIRMGYEPFVRQNLEGKAEIYSPPENCRFTQYTLRYLHEWTATVPADEIDLVHWNNGLWDINQLYGDENLTPLDVYIAFLRRIANRIKILMPKAQIIFALTTPVIEEQNNPVSVISNNDINKYNDAASRLMAELNIPVNDLYGAASTFPQSLYRDRLHFTEEGYKLLADHVTDMCIQWIS